MDTTSKSTNHAPTTRRVSVLSQILTHSVRNHDDLFALLRDDLPLRLKEQQQQQQQQQQTSQKATTPTPSHSVALIVLDSIADLFRLGNGDGAVIDTTSTKTAITQRSFLLFEISSILRSLSDQYGIPILVINQVSSDFSSTQQGGVVPTLGLSWANCINTSYLLRRRSSHLQLLSSSGNHSICAGVKSTEQHHHTEQKHHHRQHASAHSTTSAEEKSSTVKRGGRQIFLTRSARHAVNQRAIFYIETRGVVRAFGR